MKRLSASAHRMEAVALLLGFVVAANPCGHSQTFSVVHRFNWSDGANPLAGLTVVGSEPNLNFYGTTSSGGAYSEGTVFVVNSLGQERMIYQFTGGNDGGDPEAALLLKGNNLYGTTTAGGASNAGTVFEITPGGRETVLYSFTGQQDGAGPQASLVADSAGNLYSTTNQGGVNGRGTVFELSPPKSEGAPWTEKVLYSFGGGTDGTEPVAGVSFDSAGTLYGTTSSGGAFGDGTVFQLKHSSSGWKETILHSFAMQTDGGVPYAGIVVSGDKLFGAATDGGQGGPDGGGTIFELTPSSGSWKFNVIYQVPGWGISGSFSNLLVEPSGTIYATTHCDGTNSAGTVFELIPDGEKWNSKLLYNFSGGSDGQYSFSTLVRKGGSLYGTTKQGGVNDSGVVFKIAL